jgi:hypothetical protein
MDLASWHRYGWLVATALVCNKPFTSLTRQPEHAECVTLTFGLFAYR